MIQGESFSIQTITTYVSVTWQKCSKTWALYTIRTLSLSFASHPQLSGQIVEIVLLQHVAATTEATVETGCPLHSAARTKTTRMANYYRMQL